MRLKKLIVQGFKSFADRTEFVFDSPITGIVGPNGCGKSNVVDAFKWVLGEQSAKSLRGEAMLDVIFNGSGSRKPAGMAEVTMVFDNPLLPDGNRQLGLDAEEVAVGRRLFRDGVSEYQINNNVTRLRDVRELFFDTGVGVDAYSVIEQGRVAALLDSSPEDRRIIFEEAAGISRFKARKKEAQRKLERVEQNLLRVTDIVDEVDKRLRSVKIQAGKARNYQELSARLAELRLHHALREYHAQNQQLADLTAKHGDAKFRYDDVAGDLATAQNNLATRRESLESLTATRQRLEFERVQADAQMQSARQRQEYAARQMEQIGEQLRQCEADTKQAVARREAVEQSLSAERQTLATLTAELQEQRRQVEEKQRDFSGGQMQHNAAAVQIEQHKAAMLDMMRQLAGIGSRLGAIEIERKNAAMQQGRLSERRGVIDQQMAGLESAREELSGKLAAVEAEIAREQADLESRRAQAAALGKEIAQTGELLGAAREHRSGLVSRQNLLRDLEARREGVSEAVKSVLRRREKDFPFVRGLVADVLRVDVEHAHVIEAALDGRDQYLITNDSATAGEMLCGQGELEGRVNLLCADKLAPAEPEGVNWSAFPHRLRLAVDLVRFEPADGAIARRLLGRTVVVDDLSAASDVLARGPAGWRCVTLAGDVLEPDGVLRTGPLSATMGLLSRRSELEALTQQIAEVDSRIEHLSRLLADGNTQARSLEEDIGQLRNAIYQSNTRKVELTGALARNADGQNAIRRERPVLDREIAALSAATERLAAEQSQLDAKRADAEARQEQTNVEVIRLTDRQKAIAEELAALREELTARRVQMGQIQEKQLASGQAEQRMSAEMAEIGEQVGRLERSAAGLESRRRDVAAELETAAHVQAALAQTIAENESRTKVIVDEISQIEAVVGELAAKVESTRARREQIEAELHDLDLKLGELRVRIEGLVERTREELRIELPQRHAEWRQAQPDDAAVEVPDTTDEIRQLREKIDRLGNVNVEAIGELEELETRQKFLADQLADLSQSRTQLDQLIGQINTESSVRFEQTFNAVREHFQGMFRKLFGGGKADLFLETELDPPKNAEPQIGPDGQPIPPKKIAVDILDAGIEIIARPPGKQPASINQLSGGEKTMTCLALLLSVFKSRPSPFCILDEADAAMDEANNQRFNLVIQEFVDQSQFIIITHSKQTMRIAETLYGVTMQEQGVSKRVAVKFDQVDGEGRITAPEPRMEPAAA